MIMAAGAGPRIRYTRKSTEQADRQVASHDQQYSECDKAFGAVPEECRHLWFRDDKSGTTFERAEFQRMIRYCLENPQNGPGGRIEVYDHSRWGRPVRKDRRGRIVGVDIKAFYRFMYRLEDAGWEVVFTTGDKSEDELAAFLKEGIEIYIAGQKSANLSREVTRGRQDWLRKGRWVGGPPPFPAKRVHPETGQELPPGTRVYNGGSVLAVDEDKLPLWILAAEMVLSGSSLVAVAAEFERRGVRNYYEGRTKDGRRPRWTGQHIKKILTNKALTGKLEIIHYDQITDAVVDVEVIDAQWGPLVPMDLFEAVQRKLANDGTKVRRRNREGASTYTVPLMCARCGTHLAGVDVRQPNRKTLRRYRHHSPSATGLNRDARDRMVAAGCQAWAVDADEVETAVLDLIAAERGSPQFRERMEALLTGGETFAVSLARKATDAKAELDRIETAIQQTVRLLTTAGDNGLSEEMFVPRLRELQEQKKEAEKAISEAESTHAAADAQRASVVAMLDETQALLERWRTGDVADRRTILDWWVDGVMIDFEPTERKPRGRVQKQSANFGQRSTRKKLIVFLATIPTEAVSMVAELPDTRQRRTQVGPRTWDRETVRTSPLAQSSGELGTSKSPNESEDRYHNDDSKTARSCGWSRSGPAGRG